MWDSVYEFIKHHFELTLIGALTLIQVSPIKINPWSWVAKAIRGLLYGEISKKLDAISGKVDKLEEQAKEEKAIQARTHILRFSDELYDGKTHSQEYFLQMLDDIRTYEKYCAEHLDFQNGRTVQSCALIQSTYKHLWEEHKF